MPKNLLRWLLPLVLCVFLGEARSARATLELFAKGSFSKNYITAQEWTTSVSGSTGVGLTLIPQIRVEARYTNISSLQNSLVVATSTVALTLTDIKTTTTIYSVGIDIDILSDKFAFQPFLFIGGGYIVTDRSYYIQIPNEQGSIAKNEPTQQGVSANLGAGFRLRLARALAFEVECFGYGTDISKPNPLVNLYGNVGIRIFI